MIKGIDVPQMYARGIWFVTRFVYDKTKWGVYSSQGVCTSIHGTKREALAELSRIVGIQRGMRCG